MNTPIIHRVTLFCCPVCLSTDYRSVLDDSYRQCTNCSLVQQVFLPESPNAFYKREEYDKARVAHEINTALPVFARFNHDYAVAHKRLGLIESLLSHLSTPGTVRGSRFLDYGCGNGAFLSAALRRGAAASVGLETDTQFCQEVTQVTGIPVRPTLELVDNTRFIGELGYFNVVTLFDVLEHVFDPINLLVRLARVLKPSGILLVEVPDVGDIDLESEFGDWRHRKPDEHLTHWSRTSLEAAGRIVSDARPLRLIDFMSPIPGKLQAVWQRTSL